MEFRKHVLENGLEIVAECIPHAHSTALAFFVKTGSRDETDILSGVSHFLEHMVFKGTATRTAADVNRELDEMGSHSNAYTSEEHTVYYATVLPEFQDRATELLADILRPALREEDFNTEKQVILEEIAKYDDQPPYGAFEKCMALHFGSHSLGRSVLGTSQSVGALSPQQMRAYFENRYSPSNIALVAAGRVDFDGLIESAKRHCGLWTRVPAPRDVRRAAPNSGMRWIQKEAATQQYAVQICNGPSSTDNNRYAGRLLTTIIGDETGSRLFWELIDTGRAEVASMGSYEYQGTGIILTFMCCMPEEMEANLRTIRTVLAEVQQHGVTDEELARAKSKTCSQIVLHSERPSNRLFSVGNNWIQRNEYRTVREAVQAYQAVTKEDIKAILEQFPLLESTTISIGPLAGSGN